MTMSISNNKLGPCEICTKKSAIYKCPKCETVSCSLECSKKHKKLKNFCDGIRDKTKYVPLKRFGYMELVSDMSLLESAARYCTPKDLRPIISQDKRPNPRTFFQLRGACLRRNQCNLKILPGHFSRHVSNSSRFDTKNDEIFWKIVCILPHVQQTLVLNEISETMQVLEFVEMVLEKVESQVKPEDFLIYKSARPKDLSILLKQETQFANSGPRYLEMDVTKSIVFNLQNSNLVEHPVIVISHQNHASYFMQGSEDPLNLDDHELIQEELPINAFDTSQYSSEDEVSRKISSKEMSPMKPPPPKVPKLASPKLASPKPKTSLLGLVSYSSSEEDN